MTRETDCTLAARQRRLDKLASNDFDTRARPAEVELVEMGILSNRAAEIVADFAQNSFDLLRRATGECGLQIGAPAMGERQAVKHRSAYETADGRCPVEAEHAKEPDEEKEERGLEDVTKFA
jgi:hypothetical protein